MELDAFEGAVDNGFEFVEVFHLASLGQAILRSLLQFAAICILEHPTYVPFPFPRPSTTVTLLRSNSCG